MTLPGSHDVIELLTTHMKSSSSTLIKSLLRKAIHAIERRDVEAGALRAQITALTAERDGWKREYELVSSNEISACEKLTAAEARARELTEALMPFGHAVNV